MTHDPRVPVGTGKTAQGLSLLGRGAILIGENPLIWEQFKLLPSWSVHSQDGKIKIGGNKKHFISVNVSRGIKKR